MLVFVGALSYLKSWYPGQTLAHLLGLKDYIWASERLIGPLTFVLVNVKKNT